MEFTKELKERLLGVAPAQFVRVWLVYEPKGI